MTVEKNLPFIYPDSDKPMIQQWYAYPPLPLLMFSLPIAITYLLNLQLNTPIYLILLKIPFILGDLVCALLVKRLVETYDQKFARKAELAVLFNPLLIWISSAWGMFDIYMVNFILLFMLALRKRNLWLSGISFALAISTKLFPVFFLPVAAIYAIKNLSDKRQIIQAFAGFAFTLLLINFPFFITSPRGFLNQNLLMHLQRPPQGLSIPALSYYYSDFYNIPTNLITNLASFIAFFSILVFSWIGIAKIRSDRTFITSLIAIYTSVLLFNKVTNEQYFVVLVVLLILAIYMRTPDIKANKIFKLAKILVTFGVLTSAALLGFHFMGFVLPEITHKELGTSANQLVYYLSKHFNLPLYTYPDTLLTYYNLPLVISTIVMLPVLLIGFVIYFQSLYEVGKYAGQATKRTYHSTLYALSKTKYVLLLVLPLIVSIFFAYTKSGMIQNYINNNRLLIPITLVTEEEHKPLPSSPQVGTFYNVWWNNFSHYSGYQYGDWRKTSQTPMAGYYTSKNSYFVEHIKQMKEANIDFAVIPYHLYDRKRYLTFTEYAEELGLYYAPMVELYDVIALEELRPVRENGSTILGFALTDKTQIKLENVILSSIADNLDSPALMRIDGKPVVYLYDGHWFYPSWDNDFKNLLANKIISRHGLDELTERWGGEIKTIDDVLAEYPIDIGKFNSSTPQARDYRSAFLEVYTDYWNEIRTSVESKVGDIYLVSTYPPLSPNPETLGVIQPEDIARLNVFDNEFFYSIANTWVTWNRIATPQTTKWIWKTQVKAQAERNRNLNRPLMLTTTATYNDNKARPLLWFEIPKEIDGENTYDWAWETVLEYQPEYVLITSWNEFFEGTAIEPTKEYGGSYLRKTAEWSERLKQQIELASNH